MGNDYYYCIECNYCFLNEHCEIKGHHYLIQYNWNNVLTPVIEFIKEHGLYEEFLKICEVS